jgi:surfactin synthase thioesterase subunit
MESPSPAPSSGHRPGAHGRPGHTGLRLYVFPHAGGSGLMFQDWPARFPADWRVTALDAPGHGALLGKPLITDGDALVGHFLDRLGTELESPGAPFAFFGHSMGALVAYELTRRLAAEGRRLPVWLGLSACGSPQPGVPRTTVFPHDVSDAELRRRLAGLGGTPRQVLDHPALWRYFARVIRADLQLVAAWDPEPPEGELPVPVSVFGGAEDSAATRPDLARWAERCGELRGLHIFPGGHFYFRDDPTALAATIVADATAADTTGAAQENTSLPYEFSEPHG